MGKLSEAFEKSNGTQKSEKTLDPGGSDKNRRNGEIAATRARTDTQRSNMALPRPPMEKAPGLKALFESEKWDQRLQMTTDPHSPWFESFRRLRAAILYPSSGNKPRTILVTSVGPNEGKGFVCANLGVAIARDIEHHALMLDCDFRHPTLAGYFGLTNDAGLVDYLKDDIDLSLLIRKPGQPKLSLVPCGKPPSNPSEMLSSGKMKELITEVSDRYADRVVLFDSPPNIIASETGILAKQVDGIVLVVRHGVSKREHVKKFVDSIGPDKIIGTIFNAYPESTLESIVDKKLGYDYGYGSYYS
jgi:protein-tyrosine kinase